MRTYKHLWKKAISYDNIRKAIIDASKGKRKRSDVKRWFDAIGTKNEKDCIKNVVCFMKHYRKVKHRTKDIIEKGKHRHIIIPTFLEQIVHHAVIQVLKPFLLHGMYEHSYACIEGRGTHKGAKYISLKIKRAGLSRFLKFCVKLDIKHFYPSIPQNKLIEKLSRYIKDKKLMSLLAKIIKSTDVGLPLGFYTSTWLANWYLQDLDHFVTQAHIQHRGRSEKIVHYYTRYADDMVMWGSNKKELHKFISNINEELHKLGLRLKENFQVFRFHIHKVIQSSGKIIDKFRPLDFMGFKFYRNRTTLRKSILQNFRQVALRIKKNNLNIYYARKLILYNGYLKSTQIHTYYNKYIKSIIDVHIAMTYISKWERRHNGNRVQEVRKLCAA